MTADFAGVKVVLLDIEGTTTPISFVYETLFPYARKHMRAFVSRHSAEPEVAAALGMLRDERRDGSAELASLVAYAGELMDRDSKSPGLKALQGLIWRKGYECSDLHGEVFADVPEALRRWRTSGVRTAIYSSGSVLAQKLIFGTTRFGDLTSELDAFFDTSVGPKRDPASYRRIAEELHRAPATILFVSDVMPEVNAAAHAGCRAVLIVRPGNPAQDDVGAIPVVTSLSEIADR